MKLIGLFSFIIITLFLMTSSLFADPLDTYDGTEDWYKDRISDNGLIVYYDPSYEKDMKTYISYLKRKQKKILFKQKSILSKLNVNSTTTDNDEKIGDLGNLDRSAEKLDDDKIIEDSKKDDLFLIDKKTDDVLDDNKDKKTFSDDDDGKLSDEDKRLEKKKKRLKKEAEDLEKQEKELDKKKNQLYKDSNKYNDDGFVDDEELEDLD